MKVFNGTTVIRLRPSLDLLEGFRNSPGVRITADKIKIDASIITCWFKEPLVGLSDWIEKNMDLFKQSQIMLLTGDLLKRQYVRTNIYEKYQNVK